MKLFWVHMLVKFKFIISLYHNDKTQLLLYFPIFFNISWEMKKIFLYCTQVIVYNITFMG